MTLYTLIAYRPDGMDTCRGCVMGTSSSDFSLQFFTEQAPLIEAWAKLSAESQTSGREFAEYEVTLLIDGRDVDRWWRDIGNEAQLPDTPFDGISQASQDRAQELVAAIKKAGEDARQAKLNKQREEQDARDRAAYEALHKRYGAPNFSIPCRR